MASSRFHYPYRSGIEFAAFLPFYPDCMTRYIDDTDLVDRPIHIFHGVLDDYSPVAVCKAFIARAAATGHVVDLTEFPNAQHAFDVPLLPVQPVAIKGGQSARRCRIEERPVGHLRNSQTGAPFTYADACVELDPHVAHDPEATAAAHAAVKSLIAGLPKSNAQRAMTRRAPLQSRRSRRQGQLEAGLRHSPPEA